MVKVSCGFVSNSSSVTYFMMWVGVDEPPKDPCTRWVGVSTMAEELRGFPGADALHFPGESECKRHYDTTWFPCSDDGEHFLCHTCMSNWDEWIAIIKPWVQSKRMKEPSASFGDRSSTMENGATTTTALAYDLPVGVMSKFPIPFFN
ncbi:hypothetical protein Pelo_19005 [Pelomyxa schiedti]|nr:hypothetical protein Pelo_19005 [Pelomyxa schiedti]